MRNPTLKQVRDQAWKRILRITLSPFHRVIYSVQMCSQVIRTSGWSPTPSSSSRASQQISLTITVTYKPLKTLLLTLLILFPTTFQQLSLATLQIPTSGPLHLLLPLPEMLSSGCCFTAFRSLFSCRLLRKAFPGHPVHNHSPTSTHSLHSLRVLLFLHSTFTLKICYLFYFFTSLS